MYFQDVILKLHNFWALKGCVLVQPYDMEVGAGTFHPTTLLKALGPEPWNVAYVQPSRRPTDGRYGDNPNRLQHYYQYQVILKPSPNDVQKQYLNSLRVLGINPLDHDIRFVEDDWESPTLGASGLGWEVWLDGMEITQFTYFQLAGSIELHPISVELTYGLERVSPWLGPSGCNPATKAVFSLTGPPSVICLPPTALPISLAPHSSGPFLITGVSRITSASRTPASNSLWSVTRTRSSRLFKTWKTPRWAF